MNFNRLLFGVAAFCCGVAVAMGAFGAHGLEGMVDQWPDPEDFSKQMKNWDTAAKYQLLHGIAALIALVAGKTKPTINGKESNSQPKRIFAVAAVMFLVGTLIFSGCLYAMVLGAPRFFGAIVPIGGLSMIGGWLALAWAGIQSE